MINLQHHHSVCWFLERILNSHLRPTSRFASFFYCSPDISFYVVIREPFESFSSDVRSNNSLLARAIIMAHKRQKTTMVGCDPSRKKLLSFVLLLTFFSENSYGTTINDLYHTGRYVLHVVKNNKKIHFIF